jgi:serine protease inhibitor
LLAPDFSKFLEHGFGICLDWGQGSLVTPACFASTAIQLLYAARLDKESANIEGSSPHDRPTIATANIVRGNIEFALDLYTHLVGGGVSNLFFSPYSISSALAMTFAGACGDTEQEMARVLRFPDEQEQLHTAFSDLNRQLLTGSTLGYTINVDGRAVAQSSRWIGQVGICTFQQQPEHVDRGTCSSVKVFLPRFRLTEQFALAEVLKSMGMVSAFDIESANFFGITDPGACMVIPLCISEVIHKAFVEVNEEGTEAAAATAVTMALCSAAFRRPPSVPVFRADHPFVFLIRHKESVSVLFLGRVTNPEE